MKRVQVSPSILGVKKEDLIITCDKLLSSGASLIHFDVMDGEFVSNVSFVDGEIDVLSNHVNDSLLDVHLMCSDLDKYIPLYMKENVKYITFHYEAENEEKLIKHASLVRSNNILPGIVINPSTDVESILHLLKHFSIVLVMSVVPGKGGQSFIPSALDKIEKLASFRKENNLDFVIEVDGGINSETALLCKEKGVDILVAGSYILKSEDYKERIDSLL